MAFNVKTEPIGIEESSNIINLSSDEDDCILETKIFLETKPPERPRTPETHCSICLEELTNKCYSDSCWHMFCFECLKRWSTIESCCPLCKKNFKSILHTFNDQGLHEIYEVPTPNRPLSPRIFIRPFADVNNFSLSSDTNNRIFRMNLFLDMVRRNERLMTNLSNNPDPNHNLILPSTQYFNVPSTGLNSTPYTMRRIENYGQILRTRVYSDGVWAEPLPDLSGRFRESTSAFYRENEAQVHRLHEFILRDIRAIRTLRNDNEIIRSTIGVSSEDVTSTVIQTIMHYDIRTGHLETTVRPYLGIYDNHFCHELYNFATSPYDLIGYDRHVRYSSRTIDSLGWQDLAGVFEPTPVPPAIAIPALIPLSETIILDSDSDSVSESDNININQRRFDQDIIVLSSSDDSEVEIISYHVRPVERLEISGRDQPSTSTGIQNSLDRPNNSRYNLRRRRLTYSPSNSPSCPLPLSRHTYQSGVRRGGSVNYISSSTDDESTFTSTNYGNSSQSVHAKTEVVCGRRKRKVKRNKVKKKKKNVDNTQPLEIHVTNRNRSYSETSSSSGDLDSLNNHLAPIHTNIAL